MGISRFQMRRHPRLASSRGLDGQVYSLIAVLISIPLILFTTFYISSSMTIDYSATDKIVADQMHEVERSIERDFSQAMSISGKRAFLAASNYVITEGKNLDSTEDRLKELLTNGSLYENMTYVMQDNTIGDWRDKIEDMDLGFNVNIEYSEAELSMSDAFHTLLSVPLTVNMTDNTGTSRIDRSIVKEVLISIEQVEDPIFALHTYGYISRPIVMYPYPYHAIKITAGTISSGDCRGNITLDPYDAEPGSKILVTENAAGISGFLGVVAEDTDIPSVSCYLVGAVNAVEKAEQITDWSGYPAIYIDNATSGLWSMPMYEIPYQGYYSEFGSDTGPNIFERLEGELSGSGDSGMETIIDADRIQGVGLPLKTSQISIAYQYFSSSTITGYPCRGMPDWFIIDFTGAAKYNITDLLVT